MPDKNDLLWIGSRWSQWLRAMLFPVSLQGPPVLRLQPDPNIIGFGRDDFSALVLHPFPLD
jgi:hypothetical protein